MVGQTVSFAGSPFLGSNLNPFVYASGSRVDIQATEHGFSLRFQLGTGRLLLGLAWAALAGTFLGSVGSTGFEWWAVVWLLGFGGTTIALMLIVGVPSKVIALIAPPPDEVPWQPS